MGKIDRDTYDVLDRHRNRRRVNIPNYTIKNNWFGTISYHKSVRVNRCLKRVVNGRHWYFDDFYYQEYCRIIKDKKKNRWQRNHPKRELPF